MIKPEVLDALVAAGCTAEQIAAAVKADIAPRSTNAERQARYRARKNANQTVTRDVTRRNVTQRPLPDKEKSPTPPKEINPTPEHSSLRSEPKPRATRIPADFAPDLGWACADTGMSRAQATAEAEKFRDYWTAKSGQDATKLDWPATWRNWVRNSRSRGPGSRAPPARSAFQQHQHDVRQNLREAQGIFDDDRDFTRNTIDH